MESILLKKIVSPEDDITGSPEGKALLQSISVLFAQETLEKQKLKEQAAAAEESGANIVRPWTGYGAEEERAAEDMNNMGRRSNGTNRSGRGGGRGNSRGSSFRGRGRGRGRGRQGGRGRS